MTKEAKSVDEKTEAQLTAAVKRWKPAAEIVLIQPIKQDASMRRYYRVRLQNADVSAAVAMVFDSVAAPEAGGSGGLRADESCVELSKFLGAAGIAVPELFFDARDLSILLIEDLGDCSLGLLLEGGERVEKLSAYYKSAIEEIIRIQQIAPSKEFFAFQRSFTEKVSLLEMSEFTDYVLRQVALEDGQLAAVKAMMRGLAAELANSPQTFVHRDFHSWNLIVDPQEKVRVIDFQDALIGPSCYDLASLLNDRDTDRFLKPKLQGELVSLFFAKLGRNAAFEYAAALLQRDLKVAGRFEKLATQRGLLSYRRWIPGTLQRIGSNLAYLVASGHTAYEPALQILRNLIPDVERGACNPLSYLDAN